jgi:thiol-activated cytolysin
VDEDPGGGLSSAFARERAPASENGGETEVKRPRLAPRPVKTGVAARLRRPVRELQEGALMAQTSLRLASRSFRLVSLGSLVAAGALAAPACDVGESVGHRADAINSYVNGLGQLDIPEPMAKKEIDCADACSEPYTIGNQVCTFKRYTETERFDRFVAFAPNSATLWPGAVVRGADAENGLLTPVGVELAPVTFSLSLENINASPSATMDEPSLSSFRELRNKILAEGTSGATPATIDFKITQVHSAEEIGLAIGAGVNWPGGSQISASFDFTDSTKRTKILVDFTQAYYTIDVDTPTTPADFFGPNVTVDQIDDFVNQGNPPVYVQSITYGRRVVFSIESSESAEEIEAALKAAYQVPTIGANGDVSVTQKQSIDDSTINAFVLGGSGADAVGAVAGFDGLVTYITQGGDYSQDSPGAPVAYKLAYLDNAVTQFAVTTDFAEASCKQVDCTADSDCSNGQLCDGTGACADAVTACVNQTVRVDDLDLVEGDREFEGHGPNVDVDVSAEPGSDGVVVTTNVKMKETVSDDTTGTGKSTFVIPGLKTVRTKPVHVHYTDTDKTQDNAMVEGSVDGNESTKPAVKGVRCIGDTSGDDICTGQDCSYCEIDLGCFVGTAN